ncbi:MAG: hypothetical protein WBD40_13945 [Tepidisphaeraceae bacterium]
MPLVMLKSDPRARLKPCLRCGYSLKNITDSRNCPECGLAIWISLSGNDDLEMSSPEWLRRLATGTALLACANVALIAGVALLHLARMFPYAFAHVSGLEALPWLLAAYLTISGGGLFLLGAHEARYPERVRGLRRAAIVMGGVAVGFAAWVVVWRLTRNTVPPRFLLIIVTFGQAFVGWSYLAVLARRIPSRRAERLLRGLALTVGIAAAAMILNGSFWFALALFDPWSRLVIAWTLFLLLYPPAALWMLIHLAIALRRAARAAEKNWGAESA